MDLDDPAVIAATIAQALPPQEAPAKVAADQWTSKPVASLEACQSPRIFPTYEALLAEVSSQAQACGFGIVGLRSNNRNAAGQYTRIDLICERGTKHKQRGKGLKSADTRRVDCLWTAKAVMDSTGDWVFAVRVKDHNHAPSSNAALIPAKKRLARRAPDVQRPTENLSKVSKLSSLNLAEQMMLNNPGLQVEDHDVRNDRRQKRREEMAGRTNFQHFLYQLRQDPKIITVKPHRCWRQDRRHLLDH